MLRRLPFAVLAAMSISTIGHAENRSEVSAQPAVPDRAPRPALTAAEAPAEPIPAAIALPPSESISDFAITAKTRAAILTDPAMGGADVSVNTEHGVVSLAGNVKSVEQTAIASAHAQRQEGVWRIDNRLVYSPR